MHDMRRRFSTSSHCRWFSLSEMFPEPPTPLSTQMRHQALPGTFSGGILLLFLSFVYDHLYAQSMWFYLHHSHSSLSFCTSSSTKNSPNSPSLSPHKNPTQKPHFMKIHRSPHSMWKRKKRPPREIKTGLLSFTLTEWCLHYIFLAMLFISSPLTENSPKPHQKGGWLQKNQPGGLCTFSRIH